MSCLRLRLPPARRAWKSFTSKLQRKLHKPKGIAKPRKNCVKAITAASSSSASPAFFVSSVGLKPYKFLQLRFKRKGRLALRFRYNRRQLPQNRGSAAHVYVDKLFKEPAVTELVGSSEPPVAKCKQATAAAAGAESGAERGSPATADDMWESLGFASPMMHGIDERAEEFIAKFRKEMEVQEKLARDHL
ncbi:hypothetical protein FF1_035685 [Malus domestica]|uniref:DUF761 domain-containing protein n=1 Tax=Malus domestica TaxID=3750 RepID=A0A498JSU1_MALDO|nr:uncharacterized protein LOC103409105 [Malus domestica]XP_050148963.1 uncharacterized protein LOC126624011 [Malus sylvestris]RXH98275.1 hypothetical protein DVH24_010600 [Malus domestica]